MLKRSILRPEPRGSQPRRVALRWRPTRSGSAWRWSSLLRLLDEGSHGLVAGLAHVGVGLGGALGLLLEAVQDVDGVADGGDVEDPLGAGVLPDPDLTAARPDGGHGFPVGRVGPGLYEVELIAGPLSGGGRKAAEAVVCSCDEDDVLHDRIIQDSVCAPGLGEVCQRCVSALTARSSLTRST
jgi:hypothetical protein